VNADRADLAAVTDRLAAAGCLAAAEEAAELVGAAPDAATLERWLVRREDGEPPAWIVGTTTFCDHAVHVEPGVYVPRIQTEELARRAAAVLPPHGRAIDLCTGSGAIGAHLLASVPTATVVGVDLDLRAAACARRNGVPALVGDLAGPIGASGSFDVVTAVAPYVPTGELRLLPTDVQRHEPAVALDGGDDGLDLVRRVVIAAARLLRPEGRLLIEVGGDQDVALSGTFTAAGFPAVEPWWDDDGDLRGVAAGLGS
jgi:release factor glutamine methyltransferase